MTLAQLYAERLVEPSDIQGHLARFVAAVEYFKAQHVIELGTRSGVSTVAWLYALEHTGGHLTSIDLDPIPPLGDWPHWQFIQGDDLDPRIVADLEPADVVFVDTSHLYEQTRAELHVYRHLVKPGGLMMLHDTRLARPEGAPPWPLFPVRRAVGEFCMDENLAWEEFPESWGLAVIQL
jgi:predicted O-methyltransferase YrrM